MKKIIVVLLACVAVVFGASAFRIDTVKVATKYLSTPGDVTVLVPDGAPGQRFATVYLLHGHGGSNLQWLSTQPRLGELADKYGMVFVLPNGYNSWYWDSPLKPGLQMESFITKDLVPYIDKNYPTVADRSKRAVTGFSMGGHGSLYLAARHPDIFGSAGSMSGGVDIRPFPKSWNMSESIGEYQSAKDVWDAHPVATMVPQIKAAALNLTIDCGVDDFFAGVNDALHKSLLEAGVPHDYTVRPGAHTHEYWRNSILYHLLFFNEAFKRN